MAIQLTPINSLANNTVTTLVALANAIVNAIATVVVTANGSANGSLTIGNGYVSGILGASVIAAGQLQGGNVQSSANLVIASNTFINGGSFSIGNSSANSTMNSINVTVPTINSSNATISYFKQSNVSFANCSLADIELTTTGTGQVTLDSYPLTLYRTAEYLIQVDDNNSVSFQASKFIVTHDGVNPTFTEYGRLTTNTTLASFAAQTNATTLSLTVTPVSTNTTIRVLRTSLTT